MVGVDDEQERVVPPRGDDLAERHRVAGRLQVPDDPPAVCGREPPGRVEAKHEVVDRTPERSRLASTEEETIRLSLRQNGGHLARTARDLGISRTTLWRKLKRYDIDADDYRGR